MKDNSIKTNIDSPAAASAFRVFDIFSFASILSGSGVTKGPADPAVQGGAVLGGRQIVV